jgi:hypothetical protein
MFWPILRKKVSPKDNQTPPSFITDDRLLGKETRGRGQNHTLSLLEVDAIPYPTIIECGTAYLLAYASMTAKLGLSQKYPRFR